jgi:peptide-methionine (S)-S-oxide reductase
MRQGNDVGTEYRSAVFVSNQRELELALATRNQYQSVLSQAGFGEITTEIAISPTFYFAETYHQQYLQKNPDGYCGLGGTGVSCPVGLGA